MPKIYSLINIIKTTVKYFLTPKEILFLLFLFFVAILALIGTVYNLSNLFKVERIVYTGSINEGVIGFPQITNPYQQINQAEKNLSALIFSSLIKNLRIENGEVKYDLGLAQKIESSSNFSEIKILLSENAKFSNGTKITTADIIYSLQNTPVEKNWETEVVDESTIIIKFKNSRNLATFAENLEILTYPIISKAEDFSGAITLELVTSGNFKLSKIEKDLEGNIKQISLKRFDNGDAIPPYLKYYNFYYYTDEASALTDLQTKELNLLSGISGSIISKIKDDPSLKIVSSKLGNNFALFLNQNKNEFLRDNEFRQILSESIDREALVRSTLGNYAVPEKNILGENKKAPDTETLIKKIINNNKNGLFFENGVLYGGQKTASSTKDKNSREAVKISITTINNKELVDTANFVANSWKKLGIEVNVITIDRSELQTVVRDRDFDTLLFGFSVKKPSDFISFFGSEERTFPKLNIANYASKRADQLLDNLKSSKDFKEQEQILNELSKVIETDVPVIILYKPLFIQALTGKIQTIMPEQIYKEEEKYKMKEHWFTETEKVLPWFETITKLKNFTKNLDLFVN